MTETELEYQFCFNCNDRKNCYTKPKDCTRIKEEIGLQDMTNEEWFCGLSTEEKAKFLFEHGVIGCQFCKKDCVEIDYKTKECKYNISPTYSYTGIVMWLKQPHGEEDDE